MMRRTDLIFDLVIEDTEDGCICHVANAPSGPARARFVTPFSQRDLEQFWQRLREAIDQDEDPDAPDEGHAEIRQYGQRLFEALFHGEILDCLTLSLTSAYESQTCLSIHLDLISVPQLGCLPWEYMYDPHREEFLTLSVHSPLTRYTSLMHQVEPLELPKPLRALVVIANPSSYARFDGQGVWLSLLDTIDFLAADGKLVVDRLPKPTLLDLQRRLRQGEYHILHFIGHSVFDNQTGESQLVLEDEMGRSRLVNGEHLGALLRDHFSLRLAFLSSTGRWQSSSEPSAYISVAQSLVRRGIGAVVAPQFDVPYADSLAFARGFYANVCELQSVDLAAVHARAAMRKERDDLSWGALALCTRVADGRLFHDGTPVQLDLSKTATDNILLRLNSLRIRTAGKDTIVRWSDDFSEPPRTSGH